MTVRREKGIVRIAIVDFDVHNGDGTAAIVRCVCKDDVDSVACLGKGCRTCIGVGDAVDSKGAPAGTCGGHCSAVVACTYACACIAVCYAALHNGDVGGRSAIRYSSVR